MNTAEIVKTVCKKQNVSLAALARRIGQSRQNLYNKLRRNSLTMKELEQIADAIGVTFDQSFTLPDGEQFRIEHKKADPQEVTLS